MSIIVTNISDADQRSLMHHRTKGSKNGQRRYQNPDGSLTPEGYQHYKEMYGWGDKKGDPSNTASKDKKALKEERRAQVRVEKEQVKEEKAKAREEEKQKRAEAARLEKESRENDRRSVRGMTDEELNKALNRLRLEKQYSELVNERANREKNPVAAMASKLFQDAAQDLAKKALTVAVDNVIGKLKEKPGFKLGDYKDVDPYSLDSAKLQAVSQAFNNAANLVNNRWKLEHPGQDPNQQNQNQNQQQNNSNKNQNQSKNNGSDAVEKPNGPNGEPSKNQQKKMRALAGSGESVAEIAKRFGVSESTVRKYAGNQLKSNNEPNQANDQTTASEPKQEKPANTTVDRSEQNWSYMNAASSNRKQLRNNLDTTKRNVRRAEKFFDTFSKEAKTEADTKAKEERLKQFSDWVNGAEWAKEKVKIQAQQAQREEARRQAKAIADEVRRDFERRDAQAKAEKEKAEREAKARKAARRFGYSW